METKVLYLPVYIESEKVAAVFPLLWWRNKDRMMLISP